jgi:isopentenyl-diphosphate delta-isomerase
MSRISRKMEHIRHALELNHDLVYHSFDDVKLIHQCLPETDVESVSLKVKIGELSWGSPIIINAMTGGADETYQVNHDLAWAAQQCGLAMAVGSQMSALKRPEYTKTYRIAREVNPSGILFANLGGEADVEQAKRAVDMIEANAIQIHLNVMQELIMPEGDRSFRGTLKRIESIVRQSEVPVIVKEVGFGVSRESSRALESVGVLAIDVGGSGGTNFAAIENKRRSFPLDMLNEWGIPTGCSLLEVGEAVSRCSIIATGGIRHGLDVVKALVMGASAVGMAGMLLKHWSSDGAEGVVDYIEQLHEQITILMTALGADKTNQLKTLPFIVSGETAQWSTLRGLDLATYANRDLSNLS